MGWGFHLKFHFVKIFLEKNPRIWRGLRPNKILLEKIQAHMGGGLIVKGHVVKKNSGKIFAYSPRGSFH